MLKAGVPYTVAGASVVNAVLEEAAQGTTCSSLASRRKE